MKQKAIAAFKQAYRKVFGLEVSENAVRFLRNLSFSMIGFFISSLVLFSVNIMAGRLLGPEEYGRYNLVIAIANITAVFAFLGLDATSTRFISAASDAESKRKLISNFLFVVTGSSLIVTLLFLLLRTYFATLFDATVTLVLLALAIGVTNMYKVLLENVMRAFSRFKLQFMIKIGESLLVLSLFILFVGWMGNRQYQSYVVAVLLASIFVIVRYGWESRRYLVPFDRQMFLQSLTYQKLSISVSFISIMVANLDKFLVARFLGIAQFGLYSAYLMASVIIIGQIVSSLVNVFFPTVSQMEDKAGLMAKIDRLLVVALLPTIISFYVLTYVVLNLFGKSYEINHTYILLVSVIAFFQMVVGFYGAIISSSEKLFAISTKIYYAKPVFMAILYLLIYNFGLISIASMLAVMLSTYLFDAANCKICLFISERKS